MSQDIYVFIVIILALFILFYGADKKFVGHHDWNGVVYSNIARNYNRYGFIATKFGQVRNYDVTNPSKISIQRAVKEYLLVLIALKNSKIIFGI